MIIQLESVKDYLIEHIKNKFSLEPREISYYCRSNHFSVDDINNFKSLLNRNYIRERGNNISILYKDIDKFKNDINNEYETYYEMDYISRQGTIVIYYPDKYIKGLTTLLFDDNDCNRIKIEISYQHKIYIATNISYIHKLNDMRSEGWCTIRSSINDNIDLDMLDKCFRIYKNLEIISVLQ